MALNPKLHHELFTIAIAYKTSEWVLIDTETIEFGDLAKWFPGVVEFENRTKMAMLCLL